MSHTWPAELVQQVIDRNTKLIEFIERRDGQESDCYLTIHIPIEEAVILRDEARAADELRAERDEACDHIRRLMHLLEHGQPDCIANNVIIRAAAFMAGKTIQTKGQNT